MIIDVHMHLPSDMQNESIKKMTKMMDEAGVDRGVLLIVDAETINGKNVSNDFMADLIERFPEHFICFGSVDPHKGKIAINEIERIVKELKLSGLKLFPSVQKFYPSDKMVYPVYEKAQELDIPILFHSGATLHSGTNKLKYNHPIHLDEIAIDFPKLKVIAGHMGNPWFMDIYALAERHKNFYFDISGRAREFLNLVPWTLFESKISDKILFGTDMQYPQDEYIEIIKKLPINEGFIKKILGENAVNLLNL